MILFCIFLDRCLIIYKLRDLRFMCLLFLPTNKKCRSFPCLHSSPSPRIWPASSRSSTLASHASQSQVLVPLHTPAFSPSSLVAPLLLVRQIGPLSSGLLAFSDTGEQRFFLWCVLSMESKGTHTKSTSMNT